MASGRHTANGLQAKNEDEKMQKTLTINGKKLTAKKIIALQSGITNGDDYISDIGDTRLIWNYRSDEGYYNPVCHKSKADNIGVLVYNGSYKSVLLTLK